MKTLRTSYPHLCRRLLIPAVSIALFWLAPSESRAWDFNADCPPACSATAAVTDSMEIESWLKEASANPPSQALTLFFARKLMDRPYVAHTLEVNSQERLVVNTRQLDCTTLVENAVALTLCSRQGKTSFHDFKSALQLIRYRGGKLTDYTSRLHYFTDWIEDNTAKGIVREIQQPIPPFTAKQHINVAYMTTHPSRYQALVSHPEFIPTIRQQEQQLSGKTYRFIPKSAVRNTKVLRSAVADGDIIAITCRKKGLDIAHIGFAVWREDGLHLLNASMIHKKVVDEPLTLERYLAQHPSHTGIRVIRLTGGSSYPNSPS